MRRTVQKYSELIKPDSKNHEYMSNFQNILEPGNEPIMTKKYNPRVPRIFQRYLTPDELKTVVLNHPRIQFELHKLVLNATQSHKELEKKAKDILNEIGLSRSMLMIRGAGMSITMVGKRILKGINVNVANINIMREKLLANLPVLYVPTHRSYADFVLMSYIFYTYDIEIPGIAAGDNLNSMIGMGSFLRKTGAFYLRRSFTEDELYWELFRKYVHTLITDYHIGIEFFIEGTRSRENKSLLPKIGLLSMALEPLFNGEVPDVTIVPISISYDRSLEEQVYVYELLGVPKPKETTLGFFKAFKFMEERFGVWYMDFGEPISAKDYLGSCLDRVKEAQHSPHQQPKLSKDELSVIKELGFEIVRKQQERTVITTFNLITYLYAYHVLLNGKLTLKDVCDGVQFLKRIFEKLGANIALEEAHLMADILESIDIHSNILSFPATGLYLEMVRPAIQLEGINVKKMKGHCLSLHAMQIGASTIGLQIYINPCLFWVSRPAIMILASTRLYSETVGGEFEKGLLRSRVRELNEVFANEFVLVKTREEIDFDENLEILEKFQVLRSQQKVLFTRNEISDIVLSSLVPYLCCYYHVTDTMVEKFKDQSFTDKDLYRSVQQKIEAALTARINYVHPYCLSLDTIKTALLSFVANGYMQQDKGSTPSVYNSFQTKLIALREMLLKYLVLLPFTINEYCYVLSKL